MEGTAVLTKLDFDETAEINNMLSALHLNRTQLEYFAGFISFFSPVLMWDITRRPTIEKKKKKGFWAGRNVAVQWRVSKSASGCFWVLKQLPV